MSAFLNLFAPVVEAGEEIATNTLFDLMHEKNPQALIPTVTSMYIGFVELSKLAATTKGRFDDAAVNGILNGIKDTAEKYDIALPPTENLS